MVASGREKESGVVLNIFVSHLLRAVERELDGVALMADCKFTVRSASFADDIDGRAVFVFSLHEGNLRSGNDQGDGKIVVRIIMPKIRRTGVDSDICLRRL